MNHASQSTQSGRRILALGGLVLLGGLIGLRAQPPVAPATQPTRPQSPLLTKDWEGFPKRKIEPDRYRLWHEQAAQGPHMKTVAATFFGGPGYEEFVAAGELADGALVAVGNAWGPEFPSAPAPVVLGQGKHTGAQPERQVKGRVLPDATPDRAGHWVVYEPELRAVRQVVRFDWGVAQIQAAQVTPGGGSLIIAGQATTQFRALVAKTPVRTVSSAADRGGADLFVAKVSPLDGAFEWVILLEGAGPIGRDLWIDAAGAVYFDAQGLRKIAADGQSVELVQASTGRWLAVDPADGSAYYGGDRNTRTRREPWRQPFLYKYNANGERAWKLWETNPQEVGSDHGGLESDSSVKAVGFLSDGNLVVAGWSDGANSVFWRQATDWKTKAPQVGFMQPWYPSGALSFGHLSVIDPRRLMTKSHLWWCAVHPQGHRKANRTASARIERLAVLKQDAIAFTGSAGLGFIQTPNSFWKPTGTNYYYGGETLAVWDRQFSNLLFSSYLPACQNLRVVATNRGLLCVSRSSGQDGWTPASSAPVVQSLQPFGGRTDGHVLYLTLP